MTTATTYPESFKQSPNWRGSNECKGIVLHHSAAPYDATIRHCLSSASDNPVSYHCVVSLSGERTVLCLDDQRAWHAGVSNFGGRTQCNAFLLGLAFEGDTATRILTNAELYSAIEYILPRYKKYGWTEARITTHRDITYNQATRTSRKVDVSVKAFAQFMSVFRAVLQSDRRGGGIVA
jgi:N-acetyl-anhydromuramoyl-L-alanine amidase